MGGDLIFSILLEVFPNITKQQSWPHGKNDFVLFVLIPETIALLICEDYSFDPLVVEELKKAYDIQDESHEFGQIMYPQSWN
jgi:hypothetical protein